MHFDEPDTVRLQAALKNEFAEVRGFDLVTSKGKRVRIPRTTNADVRLLLGRWTGELVRAGITGASKPAWAKLVEKWEPAAAEMLAAAKAGEPSAAFGDSVRFWTTTARLAIGLSSLKAIPSKWDLGVEAIAEAAAEAPEVVLDVAKKVAGAVVDVAGTVARGAGKVVGEIGGGFFEGFGLAGVALIAGAAYVYTRRKRS